MGLRGCLGESFEQYKQGGYAAIPIIVAAAAVAQQVKNNNYIVTKLFISLLFNIKLSYTSSTITSE